MDTTSSLPRGFLWGAVRAGIKASGRADLSAIVAPATATAAALYTTNKIQAAPLVLDRRNLSANNGRVHTVLINAGNANCATGEAGIAAAEQCCAAAAEVFGCPPEAIFPSSTGIIGVPLPVEKVRTALPALRDALGDTAEHFAAIATAIMTTDTRPKTAFATVEINGAQVRIAGIAKGAGMIHPQLAAAPHATMLVYLCTDAAAEPALLQRLLEASAEPSFNRISIDGDTSTNDTVLLLASGASGATLTDGNSSGFANRARRGLHLAREADRCRRRRRHPPDRTEYSRGGVRCRRAPRRQSHRAFAPGKDRVGGQRSQLGPAYRGHRLLRRAGRSLRASLSGWAICSSANAAAAQLALTKRQHTAISASPSLRSTSILAWQRRLPLLDLRSHSRVRLDQRRLLHLSRSSDNNRRQFARRIFLRARRATKVVHAVQPWINTA